MFPYGMLNADFFSRPENKKLVNAGGLSFALYAYLRANEHANMTGVYYLPLDYINFDFPLGMEKIKQLLNELIELGYCHYDKDYHYIWVVNMHRSQILGRDKPNLKQRKSFEKFIRRLPPLRFIEQIHEEFEYFLPDDEYKGENAV